VREGRVVTQDRIELRSRDYDRFDILAPIDVDLMEPDTVLGMSLCRVVPPSPRREKGRGKEERMSEANQTRWTSYLASLLCFAAAFERNERWTNKIRDPPLVLLRYILAVSRRENVLLFRRHVLGVNGLTASLIILV
jgi:hypothetical protein